MNLHKFLDFFTLLFWLAQVLVVVVRVPHAACARRLGVASTSQTKTDALLLVVANIGMYAIPLGHLVTPWLDWADYPRSEGVAWFGVGLLAAGVALFWRSHSDLGAFWSPTLQLRQGHQLVREGIYGYVRHPMYASIFLICLAQACLLGNWLAGGSGLFAFGVFYALRIDREEAMLLKAFGAEYQSLMQQAGRLWPIIGFAVESGDSRNN